MSYVKFLVKVLVLAAAIRLVFVRARARGDCDPRWKEDHKYDRESKQNAPCPQFPPGLRVPGEFKAGAGRGCGLFLPRPSAMHMPRVAVAWCALPH